MTLSPSSSCNRAAAAGSTHCHIFAGRAHAHLTLPYAPCILLVCALPHFLPLGCWLGSISGGSHTVAICCAWCWLLRRSCGLRGCRHVTSIWHQGLNCCAGDKRPHRRQPQPFSVPGCSTAGVMVTHSFCTRAGNSSCPVGGGCGVPNSFTWHIDSRFDRQNVQLSEHPVPDGLALGRPLCAMRRRSSWISGCSQRRGRSAHLQAHVGSVDKGADGLCEGGEARRPVDAHAGGVQLCQEAVGDAARGAHVGHGQQHACSINMQHLRCMPMRKLPG